MSNKYIVKLILLLTSVIGLGFNVVLFVDFTLFAVEATTFQNIANFLNVFLLFTSFIIMFVSLFFKESMKRFILILFLSYGVVFLVPILLYYSRYYPFILPSLLYFGACLIMSRYQAPLKQR